MISSLSPAMQKRISNSLAQTYRENFGGLHERVQGVNQDAILRSITSEFNSVAEFTSKDIYDSLFALMNALYLEEQASIDAIKTLGIEIVSKATESGLNLDIGASTVSRREIFLAKRNLTECKALNLSIIDNIKILAEPRLKRLESLLRELSKILQTRVYKLNSIDTIITQAISKQLNNLLPKIEEEAVTSLMASATTSIWDALLGRNTKLSASTSTKDSISVNKSAKKQTAPLRTVTGQFYSLVSLKEFINTNLTKAVIDNMGDGNRKDILNFRTGRLAVSAFVEGVEKSRDGVVTAYYTYLKTPYATFAPGGAQSSPASRDPAKLIDRSIREVAVKKVANRLRTVLV